MTDYITIQGVRKRDFTIQAKMPELSQTPNIISVIDEEYFDNNNDSYTDESGSKYMSQSPVFANLRIVKTKKRSFVIHGVSHA